MEETELMEVMAGGLADTIRTRRSVRAFRDDPVPERVKPELIITVGYPSNPASPSRTGYPGTSSCAWTTSTDS
jgi:nitroreductase